MDILMNTKKTQSVKDLHAELPPISKQLVRFIGHKSFDSRNISFSNCHVTSCVSGDQRTIWL